MDNSFPDLGKDFSPGWHGDVALGQDMLDVLPLATWANSAEDRGGGYAIGEVVL